MPKKRKTKQQKIILQLKRKLAQESRKNLSSGTKSEPRQEAISIEAKPNLSKKIERKKPDISILSYSPSLVKKDLIKILLLALAVLSFEFMLYLRLR